MFSDCPSWCLQNNSSGPLGSRIVLHGSAGCQPCWEAACRPAVLRRLLHPCSACRRAVSCEYHTCSEPADMLLLNCAVRVADRILHSVLFFLYRCCVCSTKPCLAARFFFFISCFLQLQFLKDFLVIQKLQVGVSSFFIDVLK